MQQELQHLQREKIFMEEKLKELEQQKQISNKAEENESEKKAQVFKQLYLIGIYSLLCRD